MKRFLSTLFCLLLAVVAFAQNANGHLKFMGIPITGTISQFHTKLVAKGCTYDKVESSSNSAGMRIFKGNLAQNEVKIIVYYNTKTKIVYRVKALIYGIPEVLATQKYNEFKSFLTVKYDSRYTKTSSFEGKELIQYLALRDDKNTSIDPENLPSRLSDVAFGVIKLYISKDLEDWNSPYNYYLHIDYYDQINNEKNNKNILDDL